MSPEQLKLKRKKFLDDAVKFFNSNNLCIERGRCYYSALDKTRVGCIVGRKIKDKKLCARLDYETYSTSTLSPLKDIFKFMPKNIQELGYKFIRDTQFLHDTKGNWTANGLSESGKKEYNKIVETHCS